MDISLELFEFSFNHIILINFGRIKSKRYANLYASQIKHDWNKVIVEDLAYSLYSKKFSGA